MSASTQQASRRPLHLFLLLCVGTLWGVQPALIKFSGSTHLSETETLALVMLAVVLLLGAFLTAKGRLPRLTRETLTFTAIAGVFEYAAPLYLAFTVAKHLDAGLLTLIMATTPVFTIPLAAAVGSEKLSRGNVLACAIGIAALALIVVPQNALPSPDMLPWCLVAFSIPIIYSCGSVYVARAWPAGFEALQVALCGTAMATLLLAPFWIEPLVSGRAAELSPGAWWVLLALGAALVLEMNLYFYLLRHAGAVFTSFSSFVMIASGFVAGAILFGERPSVWVWAAVALLSLSLLLIIKAPKAATDAAA